MNLDADIQELNHDHAAASERDPFIAMASPPPSQRAQASRWGFLSQAVASVESRLDNILGEEDDIPKRPQPQPTRVAAPARLARTNSQPKRNSTEISRSGASTPTNDRLQERLAKAMAKKNSSSGSRPESPIPAQDQVTEEGIPVMGDDAKAVQLEDASRREMPKEPEGGQESDGLESNKIVVTNVPNGNDIQLPTTDQSLDAAPTSGLQVPAIQATMSDVSSARTSADGFVESLPTTSNRESLDSISKGRPSISHQLETEELRRSMQDEMNVYIERIDSLQAKLLYLTKEAADTAKQAAAAAQSGSAERRLLEKDEKIALLLEEGQKLSKTEMKHLTTLKKMRTQNLAASKEHETIKARADKAERSLRMMEDRAKKAEASSKRAEQNLASSLDATGDFEAIKKARDALNTTLADIKAQLSRANARAEAAEGKVDSEQLEKERKRNNDLQDDLTSSKVERDLSEEKLRREIKDLKASLEREKEHTRAMETEMLGEQASLESKLESFRARAEEASSSDHGDVQAKLLRQIETLQSQYAAASQNWQGIESSLLGRITNLEKERDDIATRESDVRRKLREATLKTRRAERDLEETQQRLPDLEKSQLETEEELQRTIRKTKQLESDLAASHKALEDHESQSERDILRRIEEEKAKWIASLTRTDSPSTSLRKSLGFDLPLQTHSRRPSVFPHDSNTPPRQYSVASLKNFSTSNGGIPETPSIITSDQDEYFNNVPPTPASHTPASHTHATSPRAPLHELMSTSTVGAGPSVQLVERLSISIRRLESEKAASKDELTRLTTQRDESRSQVVDLMREVEEKRSVDERLKSLEEEHKGLKGRYDATLEMLGEKSELVEELKADVADVKGMYRQLADTMK